MRQATNGAHAPAFTIRFLSGVAAIALLAGCQSGPFAEGGPFAGGGGDATRATPFGSSVQLIERDVEAPEIFQTRDQALWDGRPSLGGIWIAAPDVREPERVIIRNEENGKSVVAALFNRERDNPGPTLQLSSDAAIALGVIAGAPTAVDVVALRREEAPEPEVETVAAAALDLDETEAETLTDEIDATDTLETDDLIETATAALEAPAEAVADGAADVTETALEGADLVTEAGAELSDAAIAPATAAAAPRGNFLQRLFRRNRAEEMPADPTGLNAPLDDTLIEDPIASSAAAPAIEATSLDATLGDEVSALAPVAAPAETPDLPYVQIGIFSVEENARETADSLASSGIVASVLEQESRGAPFWRVVVGPTTTDTDQAAILRTAQDLGFADAYAVRG